MHRFSVKIQYDIKKISSITKFIRCPLLAHIYTAKSLESHKHNSCACANLKLKCAIFSIRRSIILGEVICQHFHSFQSLLFILWIQFCHLCSWSQRPTCSFFVPITWAVNTMWLELHENVRTMQIGSRRWANWQNIYYNIIKYLQHSNQPENYFGNSIWGCTDITHFSFK